MNQIFYAMPFTGKTHEAITAERQRLAAAFASCGLDLLEQFVGVEEKDYFEEHLYEPIFVARKDHALLREADLVMADYTAPSLGRDSEVVIAKEVFDRRVIAIVPDPYLARHPWLRLYSDYVVETLDQALALAQRLCALPLSKEVTSGYSREQKDKTDDALRKLYQRDPKAVHTLIPTELLVRWKALFGDENDAVLDYSFRRLPKSLRVNLLKTTPERFLESAALYGWNPESLPFTRTGFRLEEQTQPVFGKIPEYREGQFYVQEFASMLPAVVLAPQPGERVLDIAAAPGSKTTQMAEMMQDRGSILANDASEERLEILKIAVARHGLSSIEYHLGDGAVLGDAYPGQFDKVMVDAPCSCTGIIRYKAHKFLEWNLLQVYRLSEIQKALLVSGFKALKPGGTLVYSTCTYEPEENEEVVEHLLSISANATLESFDLPGVTTRPGLQRWGHLAMRSGLTKAVRIYPQDNNSVGFFMAKIRKQ